MKPVVFLDIDGVINSPKNYVTWNEASRKKARPIVPDSSMNDAEEDEKWISVYDDPHVDHLFDKDNIAILNNITFQTDADIVISSSWRRFYSRRPDILAKILKRNGVEAEILGLTPTYEYGRWEAIDLWLYQNRKETGSPIVILDDFDAPFHRVGKWLVQTHGAYGLRERDVDKALEKIFGDPWTMGGYSNDA